MKHEIWCKDNLKLNGKIHYREAVRAIIFKENKVLMLFSSLNGDYKFPGGGIEKDETHKDALLRETLEETACNISINEKFMEINEYDEGQVEGFDVFNMLSIYYFASLIEKNNNIKIEDEHSIPVWIEVEEAYLKNLEISRRENSVKWIKRETYVLKQLKNIDCLKFKGYSG